jgi:PIN domain nuclease of toxin-antitoxin system
VALTTGVLLDTHTWIWLEAGTLDAKSEVLQSIRQAASERNLFISSFSLNEIAYAVTRKRLDFGQPLLSWFQAALRYPGPQLLDVTPKSAAASLQLPPTFHGDPGDRILAATAIVHNLTLCTHDDLLLRFGKQGLFSALKVKEIKE